MKTCFFSFLTTVLAVSALLWAYPEPAIVPDVNQWTLDVSYDQLFSISVVKTRIPVILPLQCYFKVSGLLRFGNKCRSKRFRCFKKSSYLWLIKLSYLRTVQSQFSDQMLINCHDQTSVGCCHTSMLRFRWISEGIEPSCNN